MADLHLPRSLADLFVGAPRRLQLEGANVTELLRQLEGRWPGMWDRICDSGPDIRKHINIFVDGDRATLETPLTVESVVRIIPAVSGG